MSSSNLLESLYNLGVWYEARDAHERARAQLPRTIFTLGEHWLDILESIVNANYGEDINHGFTFKSTKQGAEQSIALGLTSVSNPSMNVMKKRGSDMFLLSGVASMFGQSSRLKVHGLKDRKRWGRLTLWCKAQQGLSTYQVNRDRTRGGRPSAERPSLPLPDEEEVSGSEPEMDDGQ